LPSNTGLAVGRNIDYVKVKTFNPYTFAPVVVILAKELMGSFFDLKNAEQPLEDYKGRRQKNSIPHIERV
jgi:isoleucyl-tRNA synthetase